MSVFDANVLQRQPRLLDFPNNPVALVCKEIFAVLADYDCSVSNAEIEQPGGGNILGVSMYAAEQIATDAGAHLRCQTTSTVWQAIKSMGSVQLPLKMAVAGRVFRKEAIEPKRMPVFHQMDVMHIHDAGGDAEADLKDKVEAILLAILGEKRRTLWLDTSYPFASHGMEVYVEDADGQFIEFAGAATLTDAAMDDLGAQAASRQGFAFGLGLERLAMLKYGITDIRSLWRSGVLQKP